MDLTNLFGVAAIAAIAVFTALMFVVGLADPTSPDDHDQEPRP